MQNPPPETYYLLYEIGKYLLLPIIIGIGTGLKWAIDHFTNRKDKAADQLERLFKLLADQVERKELRAKQSEKDYDELDECLDRFKTKLREARLELIDVKAGIKQIKNYLLAHQIEDESILNLVDELEQKLTMQVEALKFDAHKT